MGPKYKSKLNFGSQSTKCFNNFFIFIKSINKQTTMENEKHEAWNQPQQYSKDLMYIRDEAMQLVKILAAIYEKTK